MFEGPVVRPLRIFREAAAGKLALFDVVFKFLAPRCKEFRNFMNGVICYHARSPRSKLRGPGARPASPALQAGLGRATMNGSFLTGKPRPVGGELHILRPDEFSIPRSRRRRQCGLSLGILKSPVKGKGGPDWHRPPVRNIPRTGTGNCAHTSKKDLISEVFFVITSCTRKQFSNPEFRGQDTAFSDKCL